MFFQSKYARMLPEEKLNFFRTTPFYELEKFLTKRDLRTPDKSDIEERTSIEFAIDANAKEDVILKLTEMGAKTYPHSILEHLISKRYTFEKVIKIVSVTHDVKKKSTWDFDWKGITPLLASAQNGDAKLIKFFWEIGFPMNTSAPRALRWTSTRDEGKGLLMTPLSVNVLNGGCFETFEFLHNVGCNLKDHGDALYHECLRHLEEKVVITKDMVPRVVENKRLVRKTKNLKLKFLREQNLI